MEFVSLFNDVLGPVMRGPSSSHTAGSYRIGRMARDLLGEHPVEAEFRFDPAGSYAQVISQQGVDRGLAAGLMDWPITDGRFLQSLDRAEEHGLSIRFITAPLARPDHPNTVEIRLRGDKGGGLEATARSIGGGLVEFTELEGWPVLLTGKSCEILLRHPPSAEPAVLPILEGLPSMETVAVERLGGLIHRHHRSPSFPAAARDALDRIEGLSLHAAEPVFFVRKGKALFSSSEEMIAHCGKDGSPLSRSALLYERTLLGFTHKQALEEMVSRYAIMKESVAFGLDEGNIRMQLLRPTAGAVLAAASEGKQTIGGPHSRAAARALAVLHTSSSMGTVCAAPTGASSGVLPAVMLTLQEEKKLSDEAVAQALFAAGAVGLVVAWRATFAAETAGCQVEIGAAGAMAAAAVVDAVGGSARQAADAAAISLQNSMGSVCDLVQGVCEIPCHTRNAAAAAGAFVCADLILGGYRNPIPLDETVDAVMAVGLTMPPELRVTSLGGLAVTPSALALKRRDP